MKIYYTGADNYNDVQKDKDKSLGGYKSSTPVPNDIAGNLFGDVSYYALEEKLRETRGIIVHNNSASALLNLYVHLDKLEGAIGKFEVAFVALTPNDCDEVFMEQIDNIRATPYEANFVSADGIENKQLVIGSMAADSYIGIWIRRIIEDGDKDIFNPDTLYDAFKSGEPIQKTGGVDVVLAWD